MAETIVASTDVLSRELRGDTVLLNLKSEQYFGVSGVAARAWQLISSGKNLEEVQQVLLKEYQVSEGQLTEDLQRFVGDLASAGLVTGKNG